MKKIFFDPYKDFSNLTHEGYIYCNNFIAKVLSVYFKDNGYKTEDDTVFTDRFTISWSFHAAGFSIDYYNGKTQRAAYLMRYHDYPNIDEDFLGVTWVPSAAWVLGFVERLVYTFDMSLLKILEDENEDYERIISDSEEARQYMMSHQIAPNEWNREIARIQKVNLGKFIFPEFLSYERNTRKEIKQDIRKLLNR